MAVCGDRSIVKISTDGVAKDVGVLVAIVYEQERRQREKGSMCVLSHPCRYLLLLLLLLLDATHCTTQTTAVKPD